MTKFEKIIISAVGFLFVAVIILGVVTFQMKSALTGKVASLNPAGKTSSARSADDYKSLQAVTKQFSGAIENISGNQLTINAKLADFSKPKNPEKFKNSQGSIQITPDDFETMNKKMTVNTNEKTVFGKKPLAELKAGDMVSVDSDTSPYGSNAVLATKVIYNGQ